jgi:hypothetical protein
MLGIAMGAVGVSALGVGIACGVAALSRHDAAARAYPDRCSDQNGVDLWVRARSAGNVSTAAFIVGATSLAGGLTLWLLGRDCERGTVAQVSVGIGDVKVRVPW